MRALAGKRIFSITLCLLAALPPAGWCEPPVPGQERPVIFTSVESPPVAIADRQPGSVPAPDPYPASPLLLKGQATYLVPRGTPLKLKLASVPTSGLRLADRDLDGELRPAQLDQEITARISEDLYVDENKVIPQGTVFQGRVSRIHAPRRVGRPGSLEITFDHFKTPDGRTFAFRAQADNFRESTWKSKAKGFGIIAAHAAGGAVVGALVAYQLFGLSNTVAMHGYNIAGGAAGGALAGTAWAIMRRGKEAVLEPGDDLNMAIDTDLLLPAAVDPTPQRPSARVEGLEIDLIKSKIKKDGLDGHYLSLELAITNNTGQRLYSMDLYCEDDDGRRVSVAPGFEDDDEMNFHIEPHSIKRVRLNFLAEFPKLKRKLIWLDHRTQKVIFEERLP